MNTVSSWWVLVDPFQRSLLHSSKAECQYMPGFLRNDLLYDWDSCSFVAKHSLLSSWLDLWNMVQHVDISLLHICSTQNLNNDQWQDVSENMSLLFMELCHSGFPCLFLCKFLLSCFLPGPDAWRRSHQEFRLIVRWSTATLVLQEGELWKMFVFSLFFQFSFLSLLRWFYLWFCLVSWFSGTPTLLSLPQI